MTPGHRNFAGKMHRLTRLLTQLSEHRWARDGYGEIRMAHLQPLLLLEKQAGSNNQLAEKAGITKQSMSRLTQELLEAGYLAGEKRADDARVQVLHLTPKGQAFTQYLNTTRYDLEKRLADLLGEEQFSSLLSTTEELVAFLEARVEQLGA